jgi:hypothetical protein
VRLFARERRRPDQPADDLQARENAADARCCHRIAEALFELYLREWGKEGPPEKILLDFDAIDDPTHGDQEGSRYHGYYGQHMYHLLVSSSTARRGT